MTVPDELVLEVAEAEVQDHAVVALRPEQLEGPRPALGLVHRHLLVRDLEGALEVINEANLFPSVCGRVCPQESQCEAQCVVGRNKKIAMEPVALSVTASPKPFRATAPSAVSAKPAFSTPVPVVL